METVCEMRFKEGQTPRMRVRNLVAPLRYEDETIPISENFTKQVQQELDTSLHEPFVVETVQDAASQLARAQNGFAGIAFLFGLLALAVGGFLVANTMVMTLTERTREVGLLRAAGTTARQVLGIFGRQALALGLAGSILGVLLGIAWRRA